MKIKLVYRITFFFLACCSISSPLLNRSLASDHGDRNISSLEISESGWLPRPGDGKAFLPGCLSLGFSGKLLVLDNAGMRILEYSATGDYMGQVSLNENRMEIGGLSELCCDGNFNILLIGPDRREIIRFDRFGRRISDLRISTGGEELFIPWLMTSGPDGNIYLCDKTTARIRIVDGRNEEIVGEIKNISMDTGYFVSPAGMAVGKGFIVLTDSARDRVILLNRWGRVKRVWGGSGSGPGEMDKPSAVAVDNQRRIWVVDSGNHRVQVFTETGRILTIFSPKPPNVFIDPSDIVIRGDGIFFVADRGRKAIFKARFFDNRR